MPEGVGLKRLQPKAPTPTADGGWLEDTTVTRRARLRQASSQKRSLQSGRNAPCSACWARTGQVSVGPGAWVQNTGAVGEAEASEPSWTRIELGWRLATSPRLEAWVSDTGQFTSNSIERQHGGRGKHGCQQISGGWMQVGPASSLRFRSEERRVGK